MHILNDRSLPTAAEFAGIIRAKAEDLAEHLETAPARIIQVLREDDSTVSGPGTETNATAVAFTAEWVWESRTRGDRPQSATIIQVTLGGRAGGEGWATVEQYVCRGALARDEASMVARLATQGSLPERVGWAEL